MRLEGLMVIQDTLDKRTFLLYMEANGERKSLCAHVVQETGPKACALETTGDKRWLGQKEA